MKKQLMTGLFTVLALTAGAQTFQEWRNPEINAVNRAPMHTNYFAFENADAAKKADKKQSTNYMTLNGTWKFNWVKDADSRPTDFWKTGFNDKGWDDLQVPAVWELNGYGDPIYVNVGYAWRNQFQNNPPEVPTENNHVGSYRREIVVPASWKGKDIIAHFGSVTSNMYLWVNGRYVGYSEDSKLEAEFDLTPYLKPGQKNLIAFQVFRWCDGTYLEDQDFFRYSGVGRDCYLYARNKKRIQDIRVTPDLDAAYQNGSLAVNLDLKGSGKVDLELVDAQGKQVATATANKSGLVTMNVENPKKWSAETPYLYKAVSKIYVDGLQTDEYTTRFGIRSIELVADKGFFLNGQHRKFQGVCNHHDLGPLGAAINVAALRRQLTLLKDMGCDAIRTSHNMPAPELVELCDEMGFMMMVEPFDEWDIAKCENGYHRFFKEWAEKDMVNMLRQYRNHPSVVMWSIGNEVPTQCSPEGYKVASFLQDICHREDPTRPVTCGMDQVSCVLANGFAAMLDVPGLNYRTHRYVESYEKLPQNLVLGSETASTVSSRGVYKFPAELKKQAMYDDHQSSGYDLEACSWSNVPDEDFALADDYDWTLGQFVWTGFDYLGEPSPYDTDAWPSHSSVFGIIDLASLPKDRYYLYRSIWNKRDNTLHVLPHWTWPGREGENTPVFVYTNYPEAELFVNGKSYGKQRKLTADEARALQGKDSLWLQRRYRLMWTDVPYEPGELKVVAYDNSGKKVEEKTVRTAGKPHHLEVVADRTALSADGKDLAYITVRVVDKDGNLCPADDRLVSFTVKGAGSFRAAANGDATCLDLFHLPRMHAFSGQLTAIVQSGAESGNLVFEAKAKGVKAGKLTLEVK